jgi:hypothetical protein
MNENPCCIAEGDVSQGQAELKYRSCQSILGLEPHSTLARSARNPSSPRHCLGFESPWRRPILCGPK